MNDIFNREQTQKSGEDCYKFSKSVSYETLVGGTATICTDIKQTQRLSEGSANKPLSAVGTLTSLLCNSAKVMEKLLRHVITRRTSVRRGYLPEQGTHANEESLFTSVTCFMRLPRRIQRMLLVMTIPVFALVFTLITTAESRAEGTKVSCINGLREDGITACEKCGDNCDWSFDTVSGKLSVSGSGNMYNYSYSKDSETNAQYTTAPWKAYKEKIKSVKIEGLSTIGKYAFCRSGDQLTAVEMSDTVTDINEGAFAWNNAISTVKLSDSLKKIGEFAFRAGSGGFSPSIIVPDTLEEVELGSLGTNKKTIQNMQIICLGDELSCARVKNLFNEYEQYGIDYSRETLELAGNVVVANYEQCTSGNYFWNGAGCVREPDVSKRKCCSSCKDMGGWCNRIRYTPAEAAEVLKNDNTNEVTITFKK